MATTAAEVRTKIEAVQTLVSGVTTSNNGTLARATPPQLAPVKVAIDAALSYAALRVNEVEAEIDETAFGGIHVGMSLPLMTETYLKQSKATREASELRTMLGYLRRLRHNIITLPG